MLHLPVTGSSLRLVTGPLGCEAAWWCMTSWWWCRPNMRPAAEGRWEAAAAGGYSFRPQAAATGSNSTPGPDSGSHGEAVVLLPVRASNSPADASERIVTTLGRLGDRGGIVLAGGVVIAPVAYKLYWIRGWEIQTNSFNFRAIGICSYHNHNTTQFLVGNWRQILPCTKKNSASGMV